MKIGPIPPHTFLLWSLRTITVLAFAHKNYNFYLLLHITFKFGALNLKEEEEVRMSEKSDWTKKFKLKEGGMKTAPRNS